MKHSVQLKDGYIPLGVNPSDIPVKLSSVLSPNQSIDNQLRSGLDGIKEKHKNGGLSNIGSHHSEIYSALTRLFEYTNDEEFAITITNILKYINDHKQGHCNETIILQNVSNSGMPIERQKEYIKLMTIFLNLKDPNGRGLLAKHINWNNVGVGLTTKYGPTIVTRLKKYFNIF